jgi:hypothetical protein
VLEKLNNPTEIRIYLDQTGTIMLVRAINPGIALKHKETKRTEEYYGFNKYVATGLMDAGITIPLRKCPLKFNPHQNIWVAKFPKIKEDKKNAVSS